MPTLSITVNAEQAARAADAYGELMYHVVAGRPEGPATLAEIRQYLVSQMKQVVRDYEVRQALIALPQPDPFEPT